MITSIGIRAAESITVLGIDSSLRGLAHSLGDERTRETNDAFTERASSPPASAVRGRVERYRALVEPIVEVARQHTPRLCVIEAYAYGQNDQGAKFMAELGGVLRYRLAPHCELFVECAPNQLKKFATGFGGGGAFAKNLTPEQLRQQKAQRRKDSKGAVKKGLEALYGVSFESDDEADAYGLMRLGLCLCDLDEPKTQAQLQVVEALREKARAA